MMEMQFPLSLSLSLCLSLSFIHDAGRRGLLGGVVPVPFHFYRRPFGNLKPSLTESGSPNQGERPVIRGPHRLVASLFPPCVFVPSSLPPGRAISLPPCKGIAETYMHHNGKRPANSRKEHRVMREIALPSTKLLGLE